MQEVPVTRSKWRGWRLIAAVLSAVLALGILPLTTTPASAATGDYSVELGAPESVVVGASFNYDVTLSVEATPDDPATGIVLTLEMPDGVAFDSVPTGADSPVASYVVSNAGRTVTLTLKPLTEQLINFNIAVLQNNNSVKHEWTVFTSTLTGSAGPSGETPSDTATTTVTGDHVKTPTKAVTALPGTGNRTVTYNFGYFGTGGFTQWGARLTDTLPAGAVVTQTSAGWVTTVNADGTTTLTHERTGVIANHSDMWITVNYPAAAFPDGTTPPRNTVNLQTMDYVGTWRDMGDASAQSGVLSTPTGGGADIIVIKGANAGLDQVTYPNGSVVRCLTGGNLKVSATYVNPNASVPLESMTVEDASTYSAGNAQSFDHLNVRCMGVQFNSTLASANLPYTVEYTTSSAPGSWKSYTPTNATTGQNSGFSVILPGQTGAGPNPLTMPVGDHLTGWRVVVSPAGGSTVPVNSQVTVFTGNDAAYVGASGEAATAPFINTATSTGTATDGQVADGEDPLRISITDRVVLSTLVTAPKTIAVGSTANYTAEISNLDPSGRTYDDSTMRVVLPVGVLYDESIGASAKSATNKYGTPIPQVGDGVTVSLSTVTDALGEHQVVVFHFDELVSTRGIGKVTDGGTDGSGFVYTIPTTVLPQAVVATGSSVVVTSWATTLDPEMAGLPLTVGSADVYDFDPTRPTVPSSTASSVIPISGGLLIGKLVRANNSEPWSTQSTVDTPGTAEWQLYVRNVLPRSFTDLVVFDRLPVEGDAQGSGFQVKLSGPVTGLPEGATVEYSTDATTATDGTWSDVVEGATAFRVTVPSMAQNSAMELLFPTTVPVDAEVGEAAVNRATATGVYDGIARTLFSNSARVLPEPEPALTIVKQTNGVHYDAAPGATVATNSDVTWTYTVTNTGNTPLDDVAVADAFTAGDGSTGEFDAESSESGVLKPGATRTFQATGKAIAGQYTNTATATGVSVGTDEQPAPATDASWYFAGDAGLDIVKLTNDTDVTSAPGLPLVPGSDVTWSYAVTNTGGLDLTDVLVTDVDTDGNEVFSETIPKLAAGETITLKANGTAIEGQYHNTVTATAEDPSGDSAGLSAADDSWYYGVISSFTIDKSVSETETGSYGESETIASGADVWWKFVVTNTGNVTLTDVVIEDVPLGDPIEVGDLDPGEVVTLVVKQGNVTESYTNVAVVTGKPPTQPGGDPEEPVKPITTKDTAKVVVAPVTVLGLAVTGAISPLSLALFSAGLLAFGAVFLVRKRRRVA